MMKFLTDENNLGLHLDTLRRAIDLGTDIIKTHKFRLHKHHGIKWVNGRCLVHTPEFRCSEGKFRQYQEAESFLKQRAVGS